jgi:arginyl-tRNA synthetase
MLDLKKEVAEEIGKVIDLNREKIYSLIEKPKDKGMGNYAFPCFTLSKELHKAPQMIAEEIKLGLDEKLDSNSVIESVSNVNGFVNFKIKSEELTKIVLNEYNENEKEFGKSIEGRDRNIVIDFSSPNIAKPFHIGHLRSTVIGWALHNIYQYLGYNVTGVNHLGDWGTQFGKLIEAYKRWGSEYNLDENPIDELTKMYVRINNLCEEDETVLEACRNNFKSLEDGDPECVDIRNRFSEVSLKEFDRVYDLLGIKFESVCGEAFYTDKMPEIVDLLKDKLVASEGAQVINIDGIEAPCIIIKSNGSSTYATRDLAAIMYRTRTYDFEKALYVTSYEQILHFKQVFEVAKLLGLDQKYIDGLTHVPFGMVLLKEGKMSTREGNIIKLEDLLNTAIEKAKGIIESKNPNLENKDEVAKAVGLGAVIFNDLSNNRIKDEVFDWDTMLNFNGETGPYVQYICVRTKSVIEKAGYIPNEKEINFGKLSDEYSQDVIKILYEFTNTLRDVVSKDEPSILARYLINLAESYSVFYNNNKVILEDDKELQDARLYLTYIVRDVLEKGLNLLGINVPDKM